MASYQQIALAFCRFILLLILKQILVFTLKYRSYIARISPGLLQVIVTASPGPIVKKISGVRFYKEKDPTRSQISWTSYTVNTLLAAPPRHFQWVIARLSDEIIQNNDAYVRRYLEIILERWAKTGALTEVSNEQQSKYIQTWALSTIALSIIKTTSHKSVASAPVIREWLLHLADKVSESELKRTIKNNHSYWATLALGATGIILEDERLIRTTDQWFHNAMNQIDSDGLLSREQGRRTKALHYHYFAAAPLYIYNLLRIKFLSARVTPLPLERLLDGLLSGQTAGQLGESQSKPTEIGWMSIYSQQSHRPSAGKFDQSEFIPRLAGRPDLLLSALA